MENNYVFRKGKGAVIDVLEGGQKEGGCIFLPGKFICKRKKVTAFNENNNLAELGFKMSDTQKKSALAIWKDLLLFNLLALLPLHFFCGGTWVHHLFLFQNKFMVKKSLTHV